MSSKIKVAAVSYLNTKPLLWGIERSDVMQEIDLLLHYPSRLAESLRNGVIDMALLPIAAIPTIPGARIVSDYGIAADGDVASVAIFSQVPLEKIGSVYLDYQSRTSVRLAQVLLKEYWKKEVQFLTADTNYIDSIDGPTAGVIIGDRALGQLGNFKYVYDLAAAWKNWTGLPFVFAAWVANRDLPEDFLRRFDEANEEGLKHIDEVVQANPFQPYDLQVYFRKNIHYYLGEDKKAGLNRFMQYLESNQGMI